MNSTGPFAAAGWIACLGGCSESGIKTYNNCQKAKGHTDGLISYNPFSGLEGRDLAEESNNPCVNIRQWMFQCPAQETGLLNKFNCRQGIDT